MKQQIQELLSYYQLSAAEFSKIIGVNPSGLSHILSGNRNYLSTDTIIKIKSKYPDINLEWLILGDGEMIGGINPSTSLFANDSSSNYDEISEIEEPENRIIEDKNTLTQENSKEIVSLDSKKVKKIIVLHSDNTYEEFYSDDR